MGGQAKKGNRDRARERSGDGQKNEPTHNHSAGQITVCGHWGVQVEPDERTQVKMSEKDPTWTVRQNERRGGKWGLSQLCTAKGWTPRLAQRACVYWTWQYLAMDHWGSVVASRKPAQPRGPVQRRDVTQGSKIGLQKPSKASRKRGSEHFKIVKEGFPSHGHTSTAVWENNSVFNWAFHVNYQKVPDNEMQ